MNGYANERVGALVGLLQSRFFLILSLAVTTECIFSVYGYSTSLISLAFAVFPVLAAVGVWTLRKSAFSGAFKGYSFTFLKLKAVVQAVGYIFFIFAIVIAAILTKRLISDVNTILASIADGSYDQTVKTLEAGEIYAVIVDRIGIDRISSFDLAGLTKTVSDYGLVIVYTAEAVAAAFFALLTVCALKVSGIVTKLRNTIMFGYDERINTSFVCAVLYIFAGMNIIVLLTRLVTAIGGGAAESFGASDVITVLSDIVGAATMILSALFFGKVRQIMD